MTGITIRRIDHVVIRARDLDAMRRFYRDVLGCPLERVLEEAGLYQFRAGSSLIDIVDADGSIGRAGGPPPPAGGPWNMDHLCLEVLPWDEAAIRARLAAAGVEAGDTETRYGALGHGPSIYLRDPDGNTVELKGPPDSDQAGRKLRQS